MSALWTLLDLNGRITEETFSSITDRGEERAVVNIYPQAPRQTLMGFGGAATEAAAHTYYAMPPEKRRELLRLYFSGEGADYQCLRVSLDSCDFSSAHYEAASEESLSAFSIARDQLEIIPFIKDAEAAAGHKLPLLLSPWSPPAFMKTNGGRDQGGKLKPEYRALYAEYACRYIQAYMDAGLEVRWLTVQNEPNARQRWDSCLFTGAEERGYAADFLVPALRSHGLEQVQVLVWDHNKERAFERGLESLSGEAESLIGGIAFHIYAGDHFDAVRLLRERFPDKLLMYTEGCAGYHGLGTEAQPREAALYLHEYIGDLAAGCNLFFDWNLMLDERGGPNHADNFCSAPILCDTRDGTVHTRLSFEALRMLGQALKPGATVLSTTCYTKQLESAAVRNPDGSVALVLYNPGEKALPVNVRCEGAIYSRELPAMSFATLRILA